MKIFTLLTLFIGLISAVNADVILDDQFSSNVSVKMDEVKCTLFGKLKVKVDGLQSRAGKIAKGVLKAKRFETKCKKAKKQFLSQIQSRNNNVAVSVDLKKSIRFQTVHIPGSYDRYGRPINFPRYECHKMEDTNLNVTFPTVIVDGKAVKTSRSESRFLEIRHGMCR